MEIPEVYKHLIESDPILQYLTSCQEPVTRENYLMVADLDREVDHGEPLDAEQEPGLPEFLQIKAS